jgi:hypothetical protein
MSIYVETRIRATVDTLWDLTQRPDLHARWDLRFSSITYLPRRDEHAPQRFLYETRLGFGLRIRGEGETAGTKEDKRGARTSALRFWSDDPKSLIRRGSGYWRYLPAGDAVVFLTRYDYDTRYGAAGRLFDRLVFRPLLGWATAWSFDRLRWWAEAGVDPGISLERSAIHATARLALAAIWLYQGLVPKLLAPDSGEMAILAGAGLPPDVAAVVLRGVGVAEIAFGVALVWWWHARALLILNVALLAVLALGAAASAPGLFVAPFNPVALTIAMVALSVVGAVAARQPLPSARRCRRRPAAGSGAGEDST